MMIANLLLVGAIVAGTEQVPSGLTLSRCEELGLWEEVAERLARELVNDPDDAGTVLKLARAKMLCRQYRQSETLLAGLRTTTQGADLVARIHLMLAEARFRLDRSREAERDLAVVLNATQKGAHLSRLERERMKFLEATIQWRHHRSKYFEIFYPPDTPRTVDVPELAGRMDSIFETNSMLLGSHARTRIECFFFVNNEQGKSILGQDLGFAWCNERRIFQSFYQNLGHEQTHVISAYLSAAHRKHRPRNQAMNEGLCTLLSHAAYQRGLMLRCTHELFDKEQLPAMAELFAPGVKSPHAYRVGGAFVQFLTDTYGWDRFRQLWLTYNEQAAPFEAVYGKGINLLDAEFKGWLSRSRIPLANVTAP